MFLDYASLGFLMMGLTMAFYVFIYIHDIPYEIAKKRNHPQVEAIHVACILSLFTAHVLWPLVFIWAVTKRKPIEVTVHDSGTDVDQYLDRIAELEAKLSQLEAQQTSQPVEQGND